MILLLLQSSFLQRLIEKPNAPGASATARDWFIRAIVISVIVAGIMFAVKGFRKKTVAIAAKKAWTRGQTWLFILVGLLPVLIIMWFNYYFTSVFTLIIGLTGFFSGVLWAWILFILIMFLGHLVSPWRREVI